MEIKKISLFTQGYLAVELETTTDGDQKVDEVLFRVILVCTMPGRTAYPYSLYGTG